MMKSDQPRVWTSVSVADGAVTVENSLKPTYLAAEADMLPLLLVGIIKSPVVSGTNTIPYPIEAAAGVPVSSDDKLIRSPAATVMVSVSLSVPESVAP